jgi:predicted Zn-ribbon and HTH transcriptional regulator
MSQEFRATLEIKFNEMKVVEAMLIIDAENESEVINQFNNISKTLRHDLVKEIIFHGDRDNYL